MSPGESIQHIVEQLIPLAKNGEFPEVAQIDFVAIEDGSVSVQVHLADDEINGGLPVTTSFDLEQVFREEFEIAIAAGGSLYKALDRWGANDHDRKETPHHPSRIAEIRHRGR
jgi:hypothetical protein